MSDLLSAIITLFKYGLPGIPFSFLFLYSQTFTDIILNMKITIDNNDKVIIALILSLISGYFIQELWYWVFEICPGLKYNSSKRKVLDIINKRINDDNGIFESFVDTFNIKATQTKKGTCNKLYSIWEYIIYADKTDKEKVKRLKSYWNLFHTNIVIGLGFFLCAIVCFLLTFTEKTIDKNICFGILCFCGIIFIFKAISSRKIVNILEESWANKLIDEFLFNTIKSDKKSKEK